MSVEMDCELVDFDQDDHGVTAHIIKRGGDHESLDTVRASFLVGADGARSVCCILPPLGMF